MITYDQVKMAMTNPPAEELIDLFNEISQKISVHPDNINDDNPFDKLYQAGKFCISATSIQSDYIAFVLGKHVETVIPPDIMSIFFDLDNYFKLQFTKISGKEIDGFMYLIHTNERQYNLKAVYENIYS
ncbi:MAG: hypothetical protein AAF990_04650 [Bacteroidota bacterium]